MDFEILSGKIATELKNIPPVWNSQSAVLELSDECYPQWEQSEWIDFYFRYLCEKHLPKIVPMHEKVCGTTFFDGMKDFIPDFKSEKEESLEKDNQELTGHTREFNLAYRNYQHWRQMEWIESYFNFLCEKKLSGFLQIPGPCYHQMNFSGLLEIPWIFKTYIENFGNQKIILADADLISQGLSDFQQIGIILAIGIVEYKGRKKPGKNDENKISQKQQDMKEELRQHSIFNLKYIYFLPFSLNSVKKCETFQPEGPTKEPLREKIILDISDTQKKYQFAIKFSE
ncbi:MAG: hypothetical protein ACOC6D_00110 [Atribacterota bacterium]